MLEVDEALSRVLAEAEPLSPRMTAVSAALGCVLAEPIISDVDSPPHDKSIVDGYAVIAADISAADVELEVLEEVTAGSVPTRPLQRNLATRIMTGAPLPKGADAVVMVEQTTVTGNRVKILQPSVQRGQNIVRRATSAARGQTVLESGKVVRAIELGLFAEFGRSEVLVFPRPQVAIVATGNELVPPERIPGPGQIRNSNELLLHGQVVQAGGLPVPLGIARDDAADLGRHIEQGLAEDVLILSGGVSAGVLDLVPGELARLGVKQVFHKVSLKPGKPLWFGVKAGAQGRSTLVFGLPGNPVSSLVCFELFVRPVIEKMRGLPGSGLPRIGATLTTDHQQRGERPAYWPAKLAGTTVTPLAWRGSGDLRTLTDSNCLAVFPGGERRYVAGEEIEVAVFTEASRPHA